MKVAFVFFADVVVGYRLAVTSSKYLRETMLFTLLRSTMVNFKIKIDKIYSF